jgi:glycosyltransferase involved in cell wall biosynthesis
MSSDHQETGRSVLILSNSFCGGGAEVVARIMAETIENSSCVLFENDAGITVAERRVKVAFHQYQAGIVFTILVSIWRTTVIQWEKLRLRPSVTISHLEGPNFANMLTVLGGARVLFVHNRISQNYRKNDPRDRLKRYLCRVLYIRADKLVAVSPGVARELKKLFEIPKDKILILPNPIDRDAITQAATRHYGDDRDDLTSQKYLVSVASLTEQKNHQLMLEAYKKFIAISLESGQFKLVLIGDGPERYRLKEICRALELRISDSEQDQSINLDAQVFFLGFQNNPYRLIKRAQLLLMTSLWEGLPIALLEAMSLGIPSVVSDCSEGIRDLWQVPPESVMTEDTVPFLDTAFGVLLSIQSDRTVAATYWAQAMERLVTNPNRRWGYARACQTRAAEYDVQKVKQLWNQQLGCS